MPDELIAIYERDGERRGAYSPTDAVNLHHAGFTKVSDVDPDTMVETLTPDGRKAALNELTGLSQDLGLYDDDVPVPPPLGGAGSGTDEWRAYAAQVDVDVTDIEKRDDIVEAIRAAGKPVEQPEPDQQ